VSAITRLIDSHPGDAHQATPLQLGDATTLSPLAYKLFIRRLNVIMRGVGIQDKFSGYTFRRGGATWALKCGLPRETIQMYCGLVMLFALFSLTSRAANVSTSRLWYPSPIFCYTHPLTFGFLGGFHV
jgi:hypothetical protein